MSPQPAAHDWVAPNLPDLVVLNAVDWLSVSDAAVLVALPAHWQRVAVAGALRPWPSDAIAYVVTAAQGQSWPPEDADALVRVMEDDYPELTRPEGLSLDRPGDRRWWIIAGAPYDWTVWRADDGSLALEVLKPGSASTCTARMLTSEQVSAFDQAGIRPLTDLVAELRDS